MGEAGVYRKDLFLLVVRIDYDEFLLVADDYRHQIYMLDADGKNVSAVKFPAWDRPIGMLEKK